MPLLKRKAFEKSSVSEYLRDDDEVFHCEITDEIFKDYEEYCERIILVNSMVWSCEMTGKNNLTYSEALDSEKAARKSLKDFPMELRIPILYLATLTKRSSFAEMAEDLFNYVRERYFVGELVEACLEGDIWQEAHILSVTVQKQAPGSSGQIPASSYCYEVEQFADDTSGQVGSAPPDRVRRRKGVFSREKCRLFLKQFVEISQGIVGIKKDALDKYHIGKVHFEQIFTGPPPQFLMSKKLQAKPKTPSKTPNKTPGKPGQQSMDKFVKKTEKGSSASKPKPDAAAKRAAAELADKMRRAEEAMRRRKDDERARKKEKSARLAAYLKEWQKVKDDLQLEDHKIIPIGTPIVMEGIAPEHIGDMLSVLEFVHLYSDTLKTKDVFHGGLDVETLRRALAAREHAGVFSDLLQLLMTTVFALQEDEAEEYNEGGRITESTGGDVDAGDMDVNQAMELATRAGRWSQTYLATPLARLPLDATTVTEVVRLHLLSSGATAGSRCATWRYQQRGGYSSADDAGLRLRRERPALLRALATRHAAELSVDDKLRLLQCLMNQILSYATVRDIIEERLEGWKSMRHEMRVLQIQERKREIELVATRSRLKKECAARIAEQKLSGERARQAEAELGASLDRANKEGDAKKAQYAKKTQQMQADCFGHLSLIGMDRAYRRYWLNQSVPGVFVEAGADRPRGCLDKPVLPAPRDEDTLAYVIKMFETEKGSSDKENDSAANSRSNSPKKPLASLNGLTPRAGADPALQRMRELQVCTGDAGSCGVHGRAERPLWWVYHTEEQVEGLIQALNKRGLRESDLKHALTVDKQNILEYIKKAPVHMLNPSAAQPAPVTSTRHKKHQPSIVVPPDHTVSGAVELSLRDYILELEEKIFHGCLGSMKVTDREAWRGTLMLRGYDKQTDVLTWGPGRQYRDDCHLPGGRLLVPADADEDLKPVPNKYRDPGFYLGENTAVKSKDAEVKSEVAEVKSEVTGVKSEVTGVKSEVTEDDGPSPELVRGLASALLQIEQGIHVKYLKRPLAFDDKERKEREARGATRLEALERWEVSLMESRSFAQIFLHLFTLDSSVTWSASILNASCKICRRKTDPDDMLLCDNCNKGHHMRCLKPKLTKVPAGDWFCDQCRPKTEVKTPRKRRKLFSDDDVEEPAQDNSGSELDLALCAGCGSGGRLLACAACAARWHRECASPPPRRAARGWLCSACTNPPREVRRCAAEAMSNIHHYARALNDTIRDDTSESDSSDNETLVQYRKRGRSPEPAANGLTNGHGPRGRKSKDESRGRRSRASGGRSGASTPLVNGHDERPAKKRASRVSAGAGGGGGGAAGDALHTAELELLLRDVMKHKDCWPFYEPVSTDDVPDYLEVIDTPMDFTTIRERLAARGYRDDAALLADATLVFVNCYTYNQDSHPVAKAGARLEKYFNKRCTELQLPTLPELGPQPAAEPAAPVKRPADAAAPHAKRPRVK